MKTLRIISFAICMSFSLGMMAQKSLTEAGTKAQKALIEYLRNSGLTPSIDTRDNSVCFKRNNVFYWVTFEGDSPVLYTIHRKGLKFDGDTTFNAGAARKACNEVNLKHKIKCTYHEKRAEKQTERRVEFIMQTYAKNPSDFHGGFSKMLAAFKDVDVTFKDTYDKAYDAWKKKIEDEKRPVTPNVPLGNSPLKVSGISFGNFDAAGKVISDYDQPLRKSSCLYIKAVVDVSSSEKGLFKIGMKIFTPKGKPMVAAKGVEYSSSTNIEIKKANKNQECQLDAYGSDKADFWQAGEYKVEIYDFEKGALLYSTTFNIL